MVGVDGGGTSTIVALGQWRQGQAIERISRGEAQSSNPVVLGVALAVDRIAAAIDGVLRQARVRPEELASLCVCMAGGADADTGRVVTRELRARYGASTVVVTHDAELLLAALHPHDHPPQQPLQGVGLIAGTGSICYGSHGGRSERSGGWGYLWSDEGSGYWLGRSLLDAACRAADGRLRSVGQEEILRAVLDFTTVDSVRALVRWATSGEPTEVRQRVASLAPLAFALHQLPPVAAILKQGAEELAQLVVSVVERLGVSAGDYRLALAGGLLLHQPDYRRLVLDALQLAAAAPKAVEVIEQPVHGALRLALWEWLNHRKEDGATLDR